MEVEIGIRIEIENVNVNEIWDLRMPLAGNWEFLFRVGIKLIWT